jgi:hypothetical protein
MRKYLIAPAIALTFAGAQPAFAGDDLREQNRVNVPRGEWLSPTQIAEKLGTQGYKVIEIEADDGAYEVEMTDKNGVRVESHVHPKTGELIVGYEND